VTGRLNARIGELVGQVIARHLPFQPLDLEIMSTSCVEAGYNTFTIALRVVRGEEKGLASVRKYNWATLFLDSLNLAHQVQANVR
jgi:hypothetical protein